MTSQLFLTAVVWGSVAVVAASTALAWRHRSDPGATAFAVTMFLATWWVTVASLRLFATDRAVNLFLSRIEWVGIVYLPVAWFAFALVYTGRSEFVSRRAVAALSVLPTATLALALTNGAGHELLFGPPEFHRGGSMMVVERDFGPWLWVHVVYSYLLLAAGSALVMQVVVERRLLYRGQAAALLLVALAPWVGSAVFVAGLSPVPFFDPTPYTFVISGAAGIAALSQLQFLEAVPVTNRVARRSVVENVDAGVLVADTADRVVDANPRAASLLGPDAASLAGDRVTDWLPAEAVRSDGAVPADDASAGTRYLDASVTELTDDYGNVTGRIYLVRDVTERRRRVQRLNVLNRVLRHNLRNEMSVVHGYADRLCRGDADPERVGAEIRDRATDLTDLADKAREIDRILGDDDGPPTDVCRIASIERDRAADRYPDVEVAARTPDRELLVDPTAATAVRNLVENAIEHNTAAEPRVDLTVTADGDCVRVVVSDNGPGIPEAELTALDDGIETQLDHASGLGLWLAHWTVTAAGGSIDVVDGESSGSRVVVELPLVDGPRAGATGRGAATPDETGREAPEPDERPTPDGSPDGDP